MMVMLFTGFADPIWAGLQARMSMKPIHIQAHKAHKTY